jgi:hypothetical protein
MITLVVLIIFIGHPELIADLIPTPRRQKTLDLYMLNDEKDRLQQMKNLDKIRNTIFTEYKSTLFYLIKIEKISNVEKVYFWRPRIPSKFRHRSMLSKATGMRMAVNRNIRTADFNPRVKINKNKNISPNRNLLEKDRYFGISEVYQSLQIDESQPQSRNLF